MSRTIRVGVIGCGAISRFLHVPDLLCAAETEVVALCDVRKDVAEALAADLALTDAHVYTDHRALLRDARVEAVVVATPNYLHAPIAIDAAKARKHTLVEKPMAANLAEARAMIAAHRKAGTLLMVNQSQRRAAPHRKAKEVLDSGILGKVLYVTAMFGHSGPDNWSPTGKWFFDKKQARFGALADLGVHKADIVRYLTGKEIAEVSAFYGTLHKKKTDVDDNFAAALRFDDGTMGTLGASWTAYGEGVDYEYFHCTNGTLKVGVEPGRPLVADLANPKCQIVFDMPPPLCDYPDAWGLGVGAGFGRAILGLDPPYCTGEDGMRSLAVILAAEEAADTGRTVRIRV